MNQPYVNQLIERMSSVLTLPFAFIKHVGLTLLFGICCIPSGLFGQLSNVEDLDILAYPDGLGWIGNLENDFYGFSVSKAGDINGDNIDDVAFSGKDSGTDAVRGGAVFFLFGGGTFDNSLTADALNNILDGSNGFIFETDQGKVSFGFEISDAGDVNNDGINDFLVGATEDSLLVDAAGACYVIYGRNGNFPAVIKTSDLDGTNGFVVAGARRRDNTGWAVSDAGDFNHDGIDDFLVGAPTADRPFSSTGTTYVIYGRNGNFPAVVSLDTLASSGSGCEFFLGKRRLGGGVRSGWAVSEAGDFNGDGVDDIIIGVPRDSVGSEEQVGTAYVVFGRNGGYSGQIDLSSLTTAQAQVFTGIGEGGQTGYEVSDVGDINADGRPDIIIGAPNRDPNGLNDAGSVYFIFGITPSTPLSNPFDLSTLDGGNGFAIEGNEAEGRLGYEVNEAGDVNGDGWDDAIFSAPLGLANSSYILFGTNLPFVANLALANLRFGTGIRIEGIGFFSQSGHSASNAGDLNSDGFSDIIIGSNLYSNMINQIGAAHVVFGAAAPLPVEWLGFEAELQQDGRAKLTWATATESQNDHFVIERSTDGQAYQTLAKVPGKGNSQQTQLYQFMDPRPLAGQSHYRIRQVDFDGAFSYSNVRTLYLSQGIKRVLVAPNPTVDMISLNGLQLETTYQWELVNRLGQRLAHGEFASRTGQAALSMKRLGVNAGLYFISVTAPGEAYNLPVMVK